MNGWLVTALTFLTGTIAGTFIWLVLRPRVSPTGLTKY
jgi:hypothetical protein